MTKPCRKDRYPSRAEIVLAEYPPTHPATRGAQNSAAALAACDGRRRNAT